MNALSFGSTPLNDGAGAFASAGGLTDTTSAKVAAAAALPKELARGNDGRTVDTVDVDAGTPTRGLHARDIEHCVVWHGSARSSESKAVSGA